MYQLPLSWIRQIREDVDIKTIPIFFNNGSWLSLSKVPMDFDIVKYLINQISKQKAPIFIRGINIQTSLILQNKGFEILPLGKEAVLSFSKNHFAKSSLREIIRRGFRAGYVEEIKYSPEIENQLLEFEKESAHGSEPLLRHLYVTGFPKDTRLFVFKNASNSWLGAIVVSVNSKDKFQTEFLLRKKSAPLGIMEALVFEIYNILKKEHKTYWSLGEVPFIISKKEKGNSKKAFILSSIGHIFGFAYNYKGLYFFKNKFSPEWQPLFLAGYPRITMLQIFTVSVKSNLIKLVIFKIIQFLKF